MCRFGRLFAGATILFGTFLCAVTQATPILYYSFEPPDVSADGWATDNTGNGWDGKLETVGTGAYQYQASSPAPLSGTQSLLLTENGDNNGGRIVRDDIDETVVDFDAQDWTFSAWFNRADAGNDDFILHLGERDGFGGQNELQLYAHDADSVSLGHYPGPDVLITQTGISPGGWHHVAVVYKNAIPQLELYIDGSSVGTDSTFNLSINQLYPFAVGGHERTDSQVSRWFDGGLDDVALWDVALSSGKIGELYSGVSPLSTPEPGTLTLLAIAAALFLAVRRYRRLNMQSRVIPALTRGE